MLHDGLKGKPSTNGTWLYINEDLKIYDGMVFKANQTIFSVTLESWNYSNYLLLCLIFKVYTTILSIKLVLLHD